MITGIRIEGLRNFRDTGCRLGPVSFITGWNGAGKTTLLNAVRLALFGGWPGVAKQSDLIREGYKQAVVELGLRGVDGPIAVRLEIGKSKTDFSVQDAQGNVLAKSRGELWRYVDANATLAEIACSADKHLDGAGLAEALMTIADDMKLDQLRRYIEHTGNKALEIMDVVATIGALDKIDDTAFAASLKEGKALGAGDWTGIGDAAYRYRTDLNRQHKAINMPHGPAIAPEIDPDLGKKLSDEAIRLEKWNQTLADVRAAAKVAIQQNPEEVRAKLTAAHTEHETLRATEADAKAAREAAGKTVKAVDARQADIERGVRSVQVERDRGNGTLNDLRHRSTCPTCGQAWSASEDEIAALEGKVYELGQQEETLEQEWAQVLRELDAANHGFENADRAWVASHEKALASQASVSRLQGELAAAEKAQSVAVPLMTEPEVLDNIRKCRERIEALKAQQAEADGWRAAEKQRAQLRDLNSRIRMLDWLVEHLRKGVFQQWCLNRPLAEFVGVLDSVAARFGYAIGYEHGAGGIALTIARQGAAPVALPTASSGERTVAALCLAIGFAERGGRIGMVDNADALDGGIKGHVIEMLQQFPDSGVIVSAAFGGPAKPVAVDIANQIKPVRWVFVDAGHVESSAGTTEATAAA